MFRDIDEPPARRIGNRERKSEGTEMNGHYGYEMAKMRMAENHHWAEQERLARQARDAEHAAAASRREDRQGVSFSLKRLITHLSWT